MKELINDVLEGRKNALQVYVDLKRSEKEIGEAIKAIQDLAIDEATKYGQKTFKEYGVEITMKSGGGRWEYKHLGWWQEFQALQDQAKEAYKSDLDMITKEGEVVQPAVFKPNKDTISITL